MNCYLAVIVLKAEAEPAADEQLRLAMQALNFQRTIAFPDGTACHLPPSLYAWVTAEELYTAPMYADITYALQQLQLVPASLIVTKASEMQSSLPPVK